MERNQNLFESGSFFTGVNYWASHAGMFMWRNWDAQRVERDFQMLSEGGIEVLRVFPLWPDFQPLRVLLGSQSSIHEVRFGEDPLPDTEAGRCGVDETMADRFEIMCDLAEKYGLKLIVGLITGWMSGRCFVPECFAGRDPFTDPTLIRWEIRFVRYMVRRFRNHPAIGAWDLGNECNNIGHCTKDEAFVWASIITNTVRAEDLSHPMVSGMHGLAAEGSHPWTFADQGEVLDILCTHPYPLFTAHCNTDPINTMKSILHPTAESVYYASMGKKPCFVEEGGTLGPTVCSTEIAADYLRAAMFSAWAHDLLGFCWWCAFDQDELTHAPYDWDPIERELGLFTFAGNKKPAIDEFAGFNKFLKKLPFEKLPERILDATVVLTSAQPQWTVAYGSFLLAKEAGLDVNYVWHEDALPESDVYMLPCVNGNSAITKRSMDKLLEKVENGASLYISIDSGALTHFEKITGLKILTRNHAPGEGGEVQITVDGTPMILRTPTRYAMEPAGAEVLVSDQTGNPFFTCHPYGKGQVWFVNAPIESIAAASSCVMKDGEQIPYSLHTSLYQFYRLMQLRSSAKVARRENPVIGLTEHILSDTKRVLNLVNQSPKVQTEEITLPAGWRVLDCYAVHGGHQIASTDAGFTVTLPKNSGLTVLITKE